MTDLATIISKKRKLSERSVKAYVSTLTSLLNKCGKNIHDLSFLHDHPADVIECVNSDRYKTNSSRNTAMSALIVLTELPQYKERIKEYSKKANEIKQAGLVTEKEAENTISQEELHKVFDETKSKAETLMKAKGHIDMAMLQKIQNYIILCLCTGFFGVIRRSRDWTEMKFRGDVNGYNQMKGGKFIFSQYKTSETYGAQEAVISPELKTILSKWIKLIPHDIDFLLFNEKGKPLTSVSLGRRLNLIFGKQISTSLLRHFHLQGMFGKQIEEEKKLKEEMSAEMTKLGSSVSSLPYYVKSEKK